MKYPEFEKILSPPRLSRYLIAVENDTRRAMTLYRKNILLSQELFAVISCFEIALRNKIDRHYTSKFGEDWLLNSMNKIFTSEKCAITRENIDKRLKSLGNAYTHSKLVGEMSFGFWRFLFATNQFSAAGSTLLKIFSDKPKSNILAQYNHSTVFKYLAQINDLRNRIAHHEPICFVPRQAIKNTTYARQHYHLIVELFKWMAIDEKSLMYGLDHVTSICNDIDDLTPRSTAPLSLL